VKKLDVNDFYMVKWLNAVALHRKPISELQSVIRHMGSDSVTCHPTQVNASRLNPSQIGLVLDLPILEGWKAELT